MSCICKYLTYDNNLQIFILFNSRHPDKMKQIELRFLMNPIRFKANDRQSDRIGGVICERTQLDGEPFLQRPSGTGELEIMPADLVLVSIGYRGMPLEGMGERLFDFQKGIVAHHGGKVIGENNLFVTVSEISLLFSFLLGNCSQPYAWLKSLGLDQTWP